MIVEMKKINLANNLDYAIGLQFLERLEKSRKVNAMENKMLRDIWKMHMEIQRQERL